MRIRFTTKRKLLVGTKKKHVDPVGAVKFATKRRTYTKVSLLCSNKRALGRLGLFLTFTSVFRYPFGTQQRARIADPPDRSEPARRFLRREYGRGTVVRLCIASKSSGQGRVARTDSSNHPTRRSHPRSSGAGSRAEDAGGEIRFTPCVRPKLISVLMRLTLAKQTVFFRPCPISNRLIVALVRR